MPSVEDRRQTDLIASTGHDFPFVMHWFLDQSEASGCLATPHAWPCTVEAVDVIYGAVGFENV